MKKNRLTIALSLILFSCSTQNQPVNPTVKDAVPINLSSTQELRIAQDNAFAINLLKEIKQQNINAKNLFISPLSVSLALGMVRNGATDETRAEIDKTIGLNELTSDSINDYFKLLQSTLPSIDPLTKMSIANSIWYKNGFSVKGDFLRINTNCFGAYIKSLDFSKSYAKDTINNWCAKHTNNLIPKIIEQIPSDAVMYLTNAIYFKGIWRQKFDKTATTDATFTNDDNTLASVKMMNKLDTFGYATDELAQYLELPYGNNAYSMTVILPNENQSLTTVINAFTAAKWTSVSSRLFTRQVNVSLPRFKSESTLELSDILKTMGIKRAFTESAQFGNISDQAVMISEVVHKTYISVDEEGTEAAAVTNIGMFTTSIPDYPVFNANHPFIYIIRERSTGVIVFCGIVDHL